MWRYSFDPTVIAHYAWQVLLLLQGSVLCHKYLQPLTKHSSELRDTCSWKLRKSALRTCNVPSCPRKMRPTSYVGQGCAASLARTSISFHFSWRLVAQAYADPCSCCMYEYLLERQLLYRSIFVLELQQINLWYFLCRLCHGISTGMLILCFMPLMLLWALGWTVHMCFSVCCLFVGHGHHDCLPAIVF